MDVSNILQGLNDAQRSAVAADASVLQVLAPPGSGKTKTLTARVAYLVAHRQLKPWNIIVCTFTVKAAHEMKERITAFVGEDLAKQLQLGTFHSVALRYLKRYGHHIGLPKDFGIADAADSRAILKRLIKRLGMSMEPGQALGRISSRKVRSDDDPKSGKQTAKSVEQHDFTTLFAEYEAALAASNLLDYDDILLRCHFLLKSHPQCVSNVHAVLIDEFQDTNHIQYDLMTLFAQARNIITIVGDPDQSIYGFRAAEIKNLSRMRKQWPDTLTINLEENYRSSGAILLAAQNIIEQDESRPPKKLQATHSFGLRPVLRKLATASSEAEWLVSEIRRMQAMSGNMVQASDFAVLLRSAALSRAIEAALGKAGMPYRMIGGMKFYDRVEVKLIVDYLRVIQCPHNSEAVERTVNMPPRKVGDETLKRLREESHIRGVSLWSHILDIVQGRTAATTKLTEATKGLTSFVNVILTARRKVDSWTADTASIVDLIQLVAQKISLQAYLKQKYAADETYETRWTNIEELMAQAADALKPEKLADMADADSLPLVETLEQRADAADDLLSVFLTNIALTAAAEKAVGNQEEKPQEVTISTIHAAKGLEWPVVFIPACYDGSIPHSRADDHDEERRLLYVGMTRAQALLYLSCPVKNTQREDTSMSAFLTQARADEYFDEHGPSLPFATISHLAQTLGRDCPTEAVITESSQILERDEDNYWPLNGEQVFEELNKWDYSKNVMALPGFGSARAASWAPATTMQQHQESSGSGPSLQTGFTSSKDQYDEIRAKQMEEAADKRTRAQRQTTETTTAPKGRKRQIEGQGSILHFYKKPKEATQVMAPTTASTAPAGVLREIPNVNPVSFRSSLSTAKQTVANHKPRAAPMSTKPQVAPHKDCEDGNYVFLSSSPPREELEDATKSTASTFQPASSYHTTSVMATNTQRRTLGVRRSMQGWSARRNL